MVTETSEAVTAATAPRTSARAGALAVLYGGAAYAFFLATFTYAVFFVEGLVVSKTIDDGPDTSTATAFVINAALLTVFACQHSIMARPAFKRWWTRLVPRSVERTTYVLFATAALALVMWQWRPITDVVWEVDGDIGRSIVYGVSFAGWGILLLSTFLIDHFDLFGVKQVVRYRAGKDEESPRFQTPMLYRVVRHPLYLGFLIAFWAAPTMTTGRLLFSVATTAYILVAVQFEEHDLIGVFGDRYREYRRRTPMLLPGLRRGRIRG